MSRKRKVTPITGNRNSGSLEKYRPSANWISACGTVVELINNILRANLGSSWSVLPQGSYVQGLQLVDSDLDLVLLDGSDSWRHMNKKRTADELDRVVSLLCRRCTQYSSMRINVIQKIYRARVPLARMRATLLASGQQVELDMCFGDPSRGLCDQFVNRTISQSVELENFCLAIKIFAKMRGLTETHTGGISSFAVVLLAIYFFAQNGGRIDFVKFFQWFISLRAKARHSVSLETQSLSPRPSDSYDCVLHVAVPCKPMENAARCLSMTVWNRLLFPELARAVEICKSIPSNKVHDFDFVVGQLLNKDVRTDSRKAYVFESSSSSESESLEAPKWSDDDTVDEMNEKPTMEVVELDGSSSDEEINQQQPLVIHECQDCDYFSYNHEDFLNHRFVTHKQGQEPEEEQPRHSPFKLPRKYKSREHVYAASPPPAPKYKKKRRVNPESLLYRQQYS